MNKIPQVSFVPTPIGNLGDITKRAIETMELSDVIFAEDTRTAKSLMSALGIKKPVESYHKDNEQAASQRIINSVNSGKTLCVISEAGTPCISDPWNTLTSILVAEGITFQALPGATAFIPALLLSGFPVDNFYFHGFLPHKKSDKVKAAEPLKSYNSVIAFYESPHRVKETLQILLDIFPAPIFCCREISKIYETSYFINSQADIDEIVQKGEFVVIVNNSQEKQIEVTDCSEIAVKLVKAGYEGKDALNILKALGYKRNEAYSAIQDIVNS
ncbi:MAG: 16S rRNA (cytidine(1402)-2'-O)-methyltransferase [Denitrovibrio sp.]|nr:MAG: 16S rRNA (cytidine(1402)-2'-O)-methyltransferase [Denitrovibrio sp.]